ncbi:hypothetical protein H6776_01975 [Candidatus Nomurabacteria bacterium]|nr:hypothetical protein [Candidatus Nomurabacteria bacterium]
MKSFEEDFSTKRVIEGKKEKFQSIEDMLEKETIRPNTLSFGVEERLSTTILSEKYTKSYRPQGLIFTTKKKPDYVMPFDLVVLSDVENVVVHYYRIKDSIHFYYNHQLIEGFDRFIFKSFKSMVKKFPTPNNAWQAINEFREKNGYKKLAQTKKRLFQYNEAVFHSDVPITPIAIFGYKKEARQKAKELGLPYFRSVNEFLKNYET